VKEGILAQTVIRSIEINKGNQFNACGVRSQFEIV